MKKIIIGAVFALAASLPASAAVITLESRSPVLGGFEFDYQMTLGPDEGVGSGSKIIIYDFDGYVPGSAFAPVNFNASTELLSVSPFMIPGQTDDPASANLVFTYNGPDFRTTDGPFAPLDVNGFGAVSLFGQVRRDAFATFTIKNNAGAAEDTQLIHVGVDLVPDQNFPGAAIPEPATWAMMLGGFSVIGMAMRRRKPAYSLA